MKTPKQRGGDGSAMPEPHGSLTDAEHAGLVARAQFPKDVDQTIYQLELMRRHQAGERGEN